MRFRHEQECWTRSRDLSTKINKNYQIIDWLWLWDLNRKMKRNNQIIRWFVSDKDQEFYVRSWDLYPIMNRNYQIIEWLYMIRRFNSGLIVLSLGVFPGIRISWRIWLWNIFSRWTKERPEASWKIHILKKY